jgi:hypothetical protein
MRERVKPAQEVGEPPQKLDRLAQILAGPPQQFPRPSLKAKPEKERTEQENAQHALMVRALDLINRRCSTRYAQAIESARIFTEAEILQLVGLDPDPETARDYLAGACLAEVYDGEALAAFAKAPKTAVQMLDLRHKERLARGGYRGEAKR